MPDLKPCPCKDCIVRRRFAIGLDMHFWGDDCPYKCDAYEAWNRRAGDVAPVVHGRWISYLDGDHIMPERYYRCSRCGRVESSRQPYCHCGAKMDGELNE